MVVIRSAFSTLSLLKDALYITELVLPIFSCHWTEPVSFSVR